MRYAERDRVSHVRVLEQRLIDLARGDGLPAPVDHFPDPSGEEQVSVVIKPPKVAGAEPAINECRAVRRIILIAAEQAASPDGNFTLFVDCQPLTVGSEDRDADSPGSRPNGA